MKNFAFVLLLTLLFSCDFAPGSYPYATKYEISLSETELAERIADFKTNNPEYLPPQALGFEDGRRTEADHWYHLYFKNPKENQVMKTWIRKKSETKTTFAFIGTKDYSNTTTKWKLINKDYEHSENEEVLKEFEEIILSRLDIQQHMKGR
ncbi:hypothetical protein FGM00_03790 [Aggregatimonas sangjinii]|uniref:Outer membrane protein assembly factor BamE n=1 Tax=Aggregatimonas sangjinii TaxID=2583587 RepID=A0A5B7SL48_9FLAO|nr:hypothetical protein [Aggregatimonas sangjinii]QCW99274.1 hypothetical protein FGM00_03790 [Aggregatimonas sangjinii]